ncbi:MAG: hypothetical protein JWP94_2940 [Mucilaginibacter sp.]|nr:hypothetical protein [Mucilaginibacter sp.]
METLGDSDKKDENYLQNSVKSFCDNDKQLLNLIAEIIVKIIMDVEE